MAYLHRVTVALLLLFSGVPFAFAETCDALLLRLDQMGAAHIAGQNAAFAACGSNPNNCGGRNPAFTNESKVEGGVTYWRQVQTWDGPIGFASGSYITGWFACEGNVESPANQANKIAQALGKDGELCGLGTPTNSMCYQGYVMRGSWSGTASMNGGTNNGFCVFGPFTADGTTCTGTETGAPSGAPSTCTGGKVPGTVNGVEICVDPGTVSAPGGSGTSSGTDGDGNSTGSSSSGKETTCTGDTCTTTTTTTTTNASGGTSTGTTTTTQPKSTFCAENPSSPLCTAGSFSGACGAAPACTGDAVQCAQARYVFETSCSLAKPSDTATEFTAFDQALQAGSGDQTKNLEGNSTVNIGSASFDQTELLGAGAGLTDMTITVAGQSVELPFSILNDWFVRLGQVLVAVTFLLCIRIVTRG